MAETLAYIEDAIKTRKIPVQHTVINAAKVVLAARDAHLKNSIEVSHLVNIDGQAVVWAARFLGVPVPERVNGTNLMWELLKLSHSKGYRVYFLGATDEVLRNMIERVKAQLPNVAIAGFRNGYFKDSEGKQVAEKIRDSGADILFVGMPTPKKENFISDYVELMNIPFSMGVGGSFDVFAGKVRHAPVWVQNAGLEWFFRLAQEPRRLFKRYAVTNMLFIKMVAMEKLKGQSTRG